LLWVTFSSNRDYGLHLVNQGFDNCYPPESPDYDQPQPLSKQGVTYENCAQPQIWMAAVIVDNDGALVGVDRLVSGLLVAISRRDLAQPHGAVGRKGGHAAASRWRKLRSARRYV